MVLNVKGLLVVLIVCCIQTIACEKREDDYENCIDFDEGVGMRLEWTVDDDQILFSMSCNTPGWIAVGWGASPRMDGNGKGIDIAMGWYANGSAYVYDYFSTEYVQPLFDKVQNNKLIEGSEEEGKTTIQFSRKLDTGDSSQDLVIDPERELYFLWAYSLNDPLTPTVFDNHDGRGSLFVNLADTYLCGSDTGELRHDYYRTVLKAHGVAMSFGFLFFLLFGALFLSYFPSNMNKYLTIYFWVQGTGLFLVMLGFLFSALIDDSFPWSYFQNTHNFLGLLLIIAMVAQTIVGWRVYKFKYQNNNSSTRTVLYNNIHTYLGIGVVLVAVAEVGIGLRNIGTRRSSWLLFGISLLSPVVFMIYGWVKKDTPLHSKYINMKEFSTQGDDEDEIDIIGAGINDNNRHEDIDKDIERYVADEFLASKKDQGLGLCNPRRTEQQKKLIFFCAMGLLSFGMLLGLSIVL
eukprot:TRINITY_DN2950_c0_g1_i1.p1 TRINITY_DN2950_c0_g1~~TRINITY_DN2950_c0_g1_i1.p1  ORF type:complete len:462 (+),score=73.31 TRINITY_DN2950_c0_g1_i1:112-1497(+)